jgi:LPXTG-motif cell wall-anchored protein
MSIRKLLITAVMVMGLMSLGSIAWADPSGGQVADSEVKADTVSPAVTQPSSVVSGNQSGTLPFTGADVTLFTIIGLSAIAAGTIMVRRTRGNDS